MPKPSPLASSFCHCIKRVRKTVKVRPSVKSRKYNGKKEKEKAAIGICVKSVLQTRGKTIKRFTCKKKPYLLTQKMLK